MPNSNFVFLDKYSSSPVGKEFQALVLEDIASIKLYDYRKLKKLCRGGIPDNLRGPVYNMLLKTELLPEFETDFQAGLKRAYGITIPTTIIPPTFGGRNSNKLCLNPKGCSVVDQVLAIIGHDFPNIEYCPYLPSLCILLAHHLSSENELLGAMVSVLKTSILGQLLYKENKKEVSTWSYFPTFKKDSKQMSRIFNLTLEKQNLKIHKKINEFQEEVLYDRWMADFFIGVLPQHMIWRMLDSFMLEGYKTFFKFSLELLSHHQPNIKKSVSFKEIKDCFTIENNSLISTEKFCKSAFDIKLSVINLPKSIVQSIEELDNNLKFQKAQPKLLHDSVILKELHWIMIWSWIPPRLRSSQIELLFSTGNNGYNLSSLYRLATGWKQVLIVVETIDGGVFGSFVSGFDVSLTHSVVGDGETFLFIVEPYAKLYSWVGKRDGIQSDPSNSLFCLATKNDLTIGGGGSSGLWLNDSLTQGNSGVCKTFENEKLTGSKPSTFEISTVELFGFNNS